MRYAIWSFEHRGWWRQGKFGYAAPIESAGLYSEEEAIEIVTEANKHGAINECLVPENLLKREDVLGLFGVPVRR